MMIEIEEDECLTPDPFSIAILLGLGPSASRARVPFLWSSSRSGKCCCLVLRGFLPIIFLVALHEAALFILHISVRL